jgi:fumarylacetoacetate (FAA) hydrolase
VSNRDCATVGSACVAEKRALEQIASGQPISPYLQFGERVRLEARDAEERSVFGAIDHMFVPASSAHRDRLL